MKDNNASGVYAITCSVTDRQYIGSSRNVHSRIDAHFSALRNGRHYNPDLQADFTRHGEAAFRWTIINLCTPALLRAKEQRFMVLAYRNEENLYNIREARHVNATSDTELLAAVENF